jgi:hypothetical protein
VASKQKGLKHMTAAMVACTVVKFRAATTALGERRDTRITEVPSV